MSALPPGFVLDQPADAGLPTGFVLDKPSLLEDVAKSTGAGLENAFAGTVGMLGDARELRNKAAGFVGNKLGIPEGVQNAIGTAVNRSPLGAFNFAPTSKQILDAAPDPVVDPNYKPQTVAGGYAKTGAEFIPGLLAGGPRGVLQKLATNVAVPAFTSETAGQLTAGTEAEPYARAAGALVGGAGATKLANTMEKAAAIKAATPALADVKNEASAAYDALANRNVSIPIRQSDLDVLAMDIKTSLNAKGIRPSTADKIHNAIEEIKSPATAGAPDVADLVAARQNIKSLLGSPDANKAGAFVALGKIERAIEANSPGTMAKIREADKNWASFKANEALDKRLAKAELRAAGEHSGMNLGNKIRQQVTNYLASNEAQYLDAATKSDLEKIVRGTWTQNGMRAVANVLGGGGGLGMLAGGTAGYEAGGLPGALAGAVAGRAAKMINNRSVVNQAESAGRNIRMRSPLGQQAPLVLPQPYSVSLAALRSALLSRPIR